MITMALVKGEESPEETVNLSVMTTKNRLSRTSRTAHQNIRDASSDTASELFNHLFLSYS
jgi:hypothetical protein